MVGYVFPTLLSGVIVVDHYENCVYSRIIILIIAHQEGNLHKIHHSQYRHTCSYIDLYKGNSNC